MRKPSSKKNDDALRTQSGIRDILIKIASERRRQVNIQPTSPSYVSDLKTAVNEIAAGMADSSLKSHGDVIRVVSPRQKREKNHR